MYVLRDSHNNIIAVSEIELPNYQWLDNNNDELAIFLKKHNPSEAQHQDLFKSDAELARVLEDVIDLLTQKGVFQFTELPEAAQDKLLRRKKIRSKHSLNLIDHDSDDFLL